MRQFQRSTVLNMQRQHFSNPASYVLKIDFGLKHYWWAQCVTLKVILHLESSLVLPQLLWKFSKPGTCLVKANTKRISLRPIILQSTIKRPNKFPYIICHTRLIFTSKTHYIFLIFSIKLNFPIPSGCLLSSILTLAIYFFNFSQTKKTAIFKFIRK